MDPFDKRIPSVFVASSPFQILCSIATIKELDIDDYVVYTRLPRGGMRNNQTVNILNSYSINYHPIEKIDYYNLLLYILKAVIGRDSQYKRLFLCDMRSVYDYYIGCGYVSNNAYVVHLDDGGSTLTYLKNEAPQKISLRHRRILSFISKRRNIIFQKNMLTIFKNINNPLYNIRTLSLQNILKSNYDNKQRKDIIVVGTNTDAYCQALNLPINKLNDELIGLLKKLHVQKEGENVIFIPHGRDSHSAELSKMIEEIGCIYIRPKMMIELELLERNNPPKEIYGFTSTALYTLKQLFPNSRVVNIMFKQEEGNIYYHNYVTISQYYKKCGIELFEID